MWSFHQTAAARSDARVVGGTSDLVGLGRVGPLDGLVGGGGKALEIRDVLGQGIAIGGELLCLESQEGLHGGTRAASRPGIAERPDGAPASLKRVDEVTNRVTVPWRFALNRLPFEQAVLLRRA